MTSTRMNAAFEATAAEAGRRYVPEYVERILERRRTAEAKREKERAEREERWRHEAAELARATAGGTRR